MSGKFDEYLLELASEPGDDFDPRRFDSPDLKISFNNKPKDIITQVATTTGVVDHSERVEFNEVLGQALKDIGPPDATTKSIGSDTLLGAGLDAYEVVMEDHAGPYVYENTFEYTRRIGRHLVDVVLGKCDIVELHEIPIEESAVTQDLPQAG